MYEQLLRRIIILNHWRKKHISQDNFLIVAAAIVGILGGLAASLLKVLTHKVADFLQNDFPAEYRYYFYFIFPLIGLLLTVLYIRTFIRKHTFHHGIPPLIRSVSRERSRLDFHNSYSQVITSAITVGFGGSAGLEAPAVASGASIGSNIGLVFGLNYRETTLLLACGGGAGIAGAFNSPVAGMIFAMEVLLPTVSIPAIIPLLISSAFAAVASRLIHSEPLFVLVTDSWSVKAFIFYVIFGILSGCYSVYFSKLNEKVHHFFHKINNVYSRVLLGGAILGLLVAAFPSIYGEGYGAIQQLLEGDAKSLLANSLLSDYQHLPWLVLVFAICTLFAKTLGCVITMGSGGNGGMFGPSVGVGGLLGFIFAYALNQTGWLDLNVTNFMIAGMAASVSGVMHAPLTGIFLSAEITGSYTLLVPLMVVSAISYFINKGARKYSIYTKPLVEKGVIDISSNKDTSILLKMQLKHLIETNFEILKATDKIIDKRNDILQSKRVIFPVVDKENKLLGVLTVEELVEQIIELAGTKKDKTMAQIVQPIDKPILSHMNMEEVVQLLDQQNTRILPVVDNNNTYLGFITKNAVFKLYRRLLNTQTTTF